MNDERHGTKTPRKALPPGIGKVLKRLHYPLDDPAVRTLVCGLFVWPAQSRGMMGKIWCPWLDVQVALATLNRLARAQQLQMEARTLNCTPKVGHGSNLLGVFHGEAR
ncbi:hypothetical protein OKW33_005983 [Paraburkholderia atlantica]|uniref:Uncharacterized protein n=1 Tax=Paraburkholderia atlantica TaxID=2654982 RepID=A0A7W8QFV6_PARAM|nr:hypothetical protein [Paraburkholderia atlantica]MBB5421582.1 hypothetical protein [Paraburkholderia atlantica]MBB5429499.1 hypothetical protein [Paraburkholderia atlantica]